MGTAIVAQNSIAIDGGMRKFVPPVIRGLQAVHFLSGSISRAIRNYAKGKPDARVIGAPVEAPGYMTFKGLTNFIETQVADANTQTIFRVVRNNDTLVDFDHCPVFDGTYSSGSNLGTMLYGNTSGNINQTSARFLDATHTTISTSGVTLVSGTDIDKPTFSLIVTVISETLTVVRNETKGTVKVGAVNLFGRRPSAMPFRIGSAYEGNSLYKGVCDMSFWQHHDVELTASEIALTVDRIRGLMLKLHGIKV
ncbi:hypothetical protein [Pseudomonas taetrolens]|uniref:hypothetical protein n=1 Tax=Pseudomonas taetrolens TaxID=47884 RepID=UPI0030DBE8D7